MFLPLLVVGISAFTADDCSCKHGICLPSLEDASVQSCFCHRGWHGKTCSEGHGPISVASTQAGEATNAILSETENVVSKLETNVRSMEARAASVNETLGLPTHGLVPQKAKASAKHSFTSAEVMQFLRQPATGVTDPTAPNHHMCLVFFILIVLLAIPSTMSIMKGSPKYAGVSAVMWVAGLVYCISSGLFVSFLTGEQLGWQCTFIVIAFAVHSVLTCMYCGMALTGSHHGAALPPRMAIAKEAIEERMQDEVLQCLVHGKHPHTLHFETPAWKNKVERLFKEADVNKTGFLSVEDLLKMGYGSDAEDAQYIMNAYEEANSRTLDRSAFKQLMEFYYLRQRYGFVMESQSQPQQSAATAGPYHSTYV